jgi:hypothetical protein
MPTARHRPLDETTKHLNRQQTGVMPTARHRPLDETTKHKNSVQNVYAGIGNTWLTFEQLYHACLQKSVVNDMNVRWRPAEWIIGT